MRPSRFANKPKKKLFFFSYTSTGLFPFKLFHGTVIADKLQTDPGPFKRQAETEQAWMSILLEFYRESVNQIAHGPAERDLKGLLNKADYYGAYIAIGLKGQNEI